MKINSGNDHRSLNTATEHEALFSFGFVNNSPVGKAKVKENLRYLLRNFCHPVFEKHM